MSHQRENRPTIPETSNEAHFEQNERSSGHFRIERRETLWEARLILSTLDPRDPLAGRLRNGIRQGNLTLVQMLLEGIYRERSKEATFGETEEPSVTPRTVVRSTMLPPPSVRRTS